jgi:hypothetical protein
LGHLGDLPLPRGTKWAANAQQRLSQTHISGKAVAANLHNLNGNPCSVKINGSTKSIRSAKGETTKLL